jgi:hypothetical protein
VAIQPDSITALDTSAVTGVWLVAMSGLCSFRRQPAIWDHKNSWAGFSQSGASSKSGVQAGVKI